MKTLSKILLLSLLTLSFCFSSCKKDDELTQEEITNLVLDESETAMSLFNDVAENYNLTSAVGFKKYCPPTCPTVTFSGNPLTCTYNAVLDFGTEGCEGWNGWIRKGKIIINFTGCDQVVCTITFDQYFVNDYLVNGTQTISFNKNTADNSTVTVTIDGSVKDPDGKESTIESEMTKEWIEGYNTPYIFSDDVFSATGSASGVCSKGVAYNITITSPLIKAMNCKWIQKGEITITYGNNTIIKNYGDGTCDSLATITENGVAREIVLKHGRH